MAARVFFIAIGFGILSVFSGEAQAQIRVQIGGVGGGNHYPRTRRRNYDHARRDNRATYNHYRRNQRRNYDHAVRDIVTRGTTNPYSSPQHYYTDRRRQNNHYRVNRHRNYDQNVRDRNSNLSHYRPRRYRH